MSAPNRSFAMPKFASTLEFRMLGLAVVLVGTAAVAMQAGGQDPSQDAAWHNRQMLALAQLRATDGWQSLPGGLRWRRLDGSQLLPLVRAGVVFVDGAQQATSRAKPRPRAA